MEESKYDHDGLKIGFKCYMNDGTVQFAGLWEMSILDRLMAPIQKGPKFLFLPFRVCRLVRLACPVLIGALRAKLPPEYILDQRQ